MDNTFTLFPKLPNELRQQIWHEALTQQWTVSGFIRTNGKIKMVGRFHRDVPQSCTEARYIMQQSHTNVEPLGWINFDRHLFFFRDTRFDRQLMSQLSERHDLFRHIQHVVLYPSNWSYLWTTISFIMGQCRSLRSLVLIAPWHDPIHIPDTPEAIDIIPYEDWSPLFRKSPNNLDLAMLLQDIDNGPEHNEARHAMYLDRLQHAVARSGHDPDDLDAPYARTRLLAQRATQEVGQLCYQDKATQVYLRRHEDIAICKPEAAAPSRTQPSRRAKQLAIQRQQENQSKVI